MTAPTATDSDPRLDAYMLMIEQSAKRRLAYQKRSQRRMLWLVTFMTALVFTSLSLTVAVFLQSL